MINIQFSNLAASTLTVPVANTDSTITIDADDVAKFPAINDLDAFFIIRIMNSSGEFEIMRVVQMVDNVLTVLRSQEGTAAKEFPVGSVVEHCVTAGTMRAIIQNASETVPHARENASEIGAGSETLFGHVKITDDPESEATAILGMGISPYAMKAAFDKVLGATPERIFTESGSFIVPVTGTYRIIGVGGGGSGGASGYSITGRYLLGGDAGGAGGGGGGGGGAGQTITKDVVLTEGTIIPYTVGGPGGTTTFGSYITAVGGGNGGNGGNGGEYISSWTAANCPVSYRFAGGAGGGAGVSYGSAAQAGATGGTRASTNIAPGGAGGAGGISTDGLYGNGGRGANSPYRDLSSANFACGYTNGSSGQIGTQGCIKIKLAVG